MDEIQEGEVMPRPMTPTPNLTPMPKIMTEPRTMDFPDAMREIIAGKKITRVEWGNTDHCFLDGEWLSIFTKGAIHIWKVNDGDMLGNDWVVVGGSNATN